MMNRIQKTGKTSLGFVLLLAVCLCLPAATIERVSIDADGLQGNNESASRPAVSADARFVAFSSLASNLVPGDTNGCEDVFVYDRQEKTIERISVGADGTQGNAWSRNPAISADGRYVIFNSAADNLVVGDANNAWDTFVYDRQSRSMEIVSLASDGTQANHGYMFHPFTGRQIPMTDDAQRYNPAISADGRYVAFVTDASNLVPGDTNGKADVFVRDRVAGTTSRVSVASDGNQADNGSYDVGISADGRYVVFNSSAANLVQQGISSNWNTFLHDREAGITELISVNTEGEVASAESVGSPAVSDDGRYVLFTSFADNLHSGDNNRNWDVFLRDRQAGATACVSLAWNGNTARGSSYHPDMSSDARYIVFASRAVNLVPGLPGQASRIFVLDREAGTLRCVSRTPGFKYSRGMSGFPVINGGGQAIAFTSEADDLVSGDSNGKADIFVIAATGGSAAVSCRLTAMPPVGGSVSPADEQNINIWEQIQINATANPDYAFTGWTISSGKASIADSTASETSVSLSENSVITANFTQTHALMSVSVSPQDSGSTVPRRQQRVEIGVPVTIKAFPADNHRFNGWRATGGATFADADSAETTVTLAADARITAYFTKAKAEMSLAINPPGAGYSEPIPGWVSRFDTNSVVNISCGANEGYRFENWTVGNANAVIARANRQETEITLLGNTTLTANFIKTRPLLTVQVDGDGRTRPDAGTETAVAGGRNIRIRAYPNENSVFAGWELISGDAVLRDSTSSVSTVVLRTDATVRANFAPKTGTITMHHAGEGSTDPESGEYILEFGVPMPISATPADGRFFTHWSGTEAAKFADPNSPNTNVTISGDARIAAVFSSHSADEIRLATGAVIELHPGQLPGDLDMFPRRPIARAVYDDRIRGRDGLTTALRYRGGHHDAHALFEWFRRIYLYDRRDARRVQLSTDAPPISNELELDGIFVTLDRNRDPVRLPKTVYLVSPVITGISGTAQNAGDIFTIHGRYFGDRIPKILIETKNGDRIRYYRCRVDRRASQIYLDAIGRESRSPMKVLGHDPADNAELGTSRVTVAYPRISQHYTPTGFIVLDNGISLDIYQLEK